MGLEFAQVYNMHINGCLFGACLKEIRKNGKNFVACGDCVKYHFSKYMLGEY